MTRATLVSLLTLALLVSPGPADAKTYRWVDPKGVVTYSDRPPQLAPVEGERDALIEEALTISGIKRQIEDLPEQVRAGADASQSQLRPKERAALAKIIGAAFRSGPILTTVRSAFQKSYDPMQMGLLLAQLRTPTARKMAVLEGAGSEPDVVAKLQTFAAGLKDAPPAEDRVARLVRLDVATGTTDLVIEMRAASIAAAFKVLSALMPPEKRLPPAQMNAAVRNLVGQQREIARREILVLFLFIYREATDAELDEYIGIGSSESGRWFQTIYRRGLAEAITTATETAIRQVAKSFRPERL
jgi:hypothetical protein